MPSRHLDDISDNSGKLSVFPVALGAVIPKRESCSSFVFILSSLISIRLSLSQASNMMVPSQGRRLICVIIQPDGHELDRRIALSPVLGSLRHDWIPNVHILAQPHIYLGWYQTVRGRLFKM